MRLIISCFSGKSACLGMSCPRWNLMACVVAGVALLASGGVFSSSVTAQLGLFPTLFLGSVITGCVAMQLAELSRAAHPQH